jgi:predicted nucleic acid-binding protein
VSGTLLLDTGPLVAYLNRRDDYHEWAASVLDPITQPLLTCDPVLAEACHLLRRLPGGPEAVLELLERGALRVNFPVAENARALSALMRKYRDAPMSLADACLVRMAERAEDPAVITVDRHFRIYRIHGRRIVRTILPPGV